MSYHPFKNAGIRRMWLLASVQEHGPRCWLCCHPLPDILGLPVEPIWATTFDHVVPRSLGGGENHKNLRLAHRRCNSKRGTLAVDEALRASLRLQVPRRIRSLPMTEAKA